MIDWRSHTTLVQVAGIVSLAAIAMAGCVYGQIGAALFVFSVGSVIVWLLS